MPFTGQLGTVNSSLGNIVLGTAGGGGGGGNTYNLSLTFTSEAGLVRDSGQSFDLSATITGTAGSSYDAVVSHVANNNIVFSQTISFTASRIFNTGNLLIFSQTATYLINKVGSASNHLELSQLATGTTGKPASNRLNLTQLATAFVIRYATASNHLTLNSSSRAPGRVFASNILVFTQSATYNAVFNRLAHNSILYSGISGFGSNQQHGVFNQLHLIQDLTGFIVRTGHNTLTLTQLATCQKILNHFASNHLNLVQNGSKTSVLNLSASNVLTFSQGFSKVLGPYIVTSNGAIASVVGQKCLMKLEAPDQAIILPCPNLGDGIENASSLVLKKSMGNNTYTYIKTSQYQKVRYTWDLDRVKSLELRQLIHGRSTVPYYIYNWKGEIWYAFINNNPIEFIPKRRAVSCLGQERVEVTIEFIGVRII